MYGRNRQSIADLVESLHSIFRDHPDSYEDSNGDPALPARCLPDVFYTYKRDYDIELLNPEELQQFLTLLEKTPDISVTPDLLIGLVAQRTSYSPDGTDPDGGSRGRGEERTAGRQSRSSSSNSTGTFYAGSRPPSRGGAVPPSPFDAQKRQRTTPLGVAAPSSWATRPRAPARRKSDAGGHARTVSDSEVSLALSDLNARISVSPGPVASSPTSKVLASGPGLWPLPLSPCHFFFEDLPTLPGPSTMRCLYSTAWVAYVAC
jgi:hypothetical protein